MAGEGVTELEQLTAAGFTPEEIEDWKSNTTKELFSAGFSESEVDDYFGIEEPDFSGIKTILSANYQKNRKEETPQESKQEAGAEDQAGDAGPRVEKAETFIEALEAGYDMSVQGLISERPDVVLPENAPMYMRIASQVGTLAGDVPAMVAGGLAGGVTAGAVGSVVPVAGTAAGAAIGTGAGAFALPAALRTAMMEHYEKGDVKNFSDFWERSSAVFVESLKAGTIGAATMGVGGLVGKAVAGAAVPAAAKTSAIVASEVATMTTVGAGLEGRVPEPHEFVDAAILVGGLKGTVKVASKIRNTYAKTGVTPAEVNTLSAKDPHVKQQLLSENIALPEGIKTVATEHGAFVKPTAPKTFNVSKLKTKPEIKLAPEVQNILGKVGEKGKPLVKKVDVRKAYTDFVDKLDPINQATKTLSKISKIDSLTADKNPYILSRMVVDHKAKAKHFFEKGVLDYNTLKVKSKSLKSILEGVENAEILDAYMISKRVIEKSSQGLKTGFDVAAAKKVVKQNKAKYEKAAKEVTEFSNATLEYVKDSGILSAEQVVRMKELNKNYVPFKRIIEASEAVGARKPGGKAGSLKKFKGSEREIQSPITSIVENTVELLKIAETNRPMVELIKLAEQAKGQELIMKVKTPAKPVKVQKTQLKKALKEKGLSAELSEIVSEKAGDLTTYVRQQRDLTPTQFQVFKNGKRTVYETTPELATAIKSLGGDAGATNMAFRIARGVTTFKKFGITFTPDFILRNLMRDKVTAAIFSESKGISISNIVGSMGDIIKKNDTYYNWLKSGGANGAFLELNNRYIAKDIRGLQKSTNFMNSVRNLVEKPIDAMRVAAELSEQSIRLAEFKKVSKGLTDPASLKKGGIAAREITIDFQRVGAKMSALNSITAFMNVSVQGLDRTVRAFKENPKAAATKAAAYITAPSVLLWWANKDDKRYQEIPRWEKDLFWIIPTDDWQDATEAEAGGLPDYMVRTKNGKMQVNKGNIYRIPKPMELGVTFGSLPERVLDAFFTDNPKAFKDFEETMVGLVTPSFIPDAVAPAMEQFFNKNFFTGRDIVPHHLKDVLPEYQFVQYTSDTAKTLGKVISSTGITRDKSIASPMVIDNYIRSWGGSLGQYAIQLADTALRKTGVAPDITKPSATLSDLPFIKSFAVRFPRSGSRSVQDFYTQYDKAKVMHTTIKHLARQGDFENMERELTLERNQELLIKLDGVKDALSNQSRFTRLVHKNPELSADEKRQMIDSVYLMMIETARQGNDMMEILKKAVNPEEE